jgi:predicted fused transcriptional regulator/phosphomethylpyrimidine kinase
MNVGMEVKRPWRMSKAEMTIWDVMVDRGTTGDEPMSDGGR